MSEVTQIQGLNEANIVVAEVPEKIKKNFFHQLPVILVLLMINVCQF